MSANDNPRTCLTCRYFYIKTGEPHYSDLTPGIDSDIGCLRRDWRYEPDEDTESSYREKMLMAESCSSYEYYKDHKGEDVTNEDP